jgi:hypothetical protein
MLTSTTTPRTVAVLKPPRNVPALITYATGIVRAVDGNASLPSPVPPVADLQSAIDDLQAAETDAQTRARGAVATRNAKRSTLVALLQQLRTYVQTRADASPESAPAIIESAGIAVRKPMPPVARGFHSRPGRVSGSVELVALSAGDRASYEWQTSVDEGNTWTRLPTTLQASTSVAGLTPLTTMVARYRVIGKQGEGEWGQSLAVIVM